MKLRHICFISTWVLILSVCATGLCVDVDRRIYARQNAMEAVVQKEYEYLENEHNVSLLTRNELVRLNYMLIDIESIVVSTDDMIQWLKNAKSCELPTITRFKRILMEEFDKFNELYSKYIQKIEIVKLRKNV